jgi:hypothetical protein
MSTCDRFSQVVRVGEMYRLLYIIMQITTGDSGVLGPGTVSLGGGGD